MLYINTDSLTQPRTMIVTGSAIIAVTLDKTPQIRCFSFSSLMLPIPIPDQGSDHEQIHSSILSPSHNVAVVSGRHSK